MPGPARSSASWKAPAQNVGLKRAKPMFSRQGDRARPRGAQWVGGSPGSDSQPSRFTGHDGAGTGIRSGQGSCENPTQCQKLGSKSYQRQTGSYHPFSFPTFPPQKELRETQCQVEGSQEMGENLRMRPGRHHLLTLRSNLLASVCPSVK